MIRDVGNGAVELQGPGGSVQTVRPFDVPGVQTWTGPCTVAETDDEFWIGAGPGGGPVFQRRSRFLPGYPQIGGDVFLADYRTRAGVVFPQRRNVVLSFGAGFPLVLTFERSIGQGGWCGDVAWNVYDLLRQCGVQVRNTRPQTPPGDYGQCVVGVLPWGAWAGLTVANFPRTRGGPDSVVHCYTVALGDPRHTAVLIVHEFCHAMLRENHTTRPGDVRNEAPGPSARLYPGDAQTIYDLTAPWRT